jgi:glucose/arabinose dehydrogenase
MAFHPDYAKNHQVFISYTRSGSPLISYVSRFTSVDNGKTLDESSEQVVINVNQPYGNHNGGNIAFGPDNYLYIGFGDGGSGGDPQGNGQNKNTLLGAMLRVNVDGAPPYEIPADNPFVKNSNARPEIYAYGLRNPWRWSFDKKTGQLWLGDVGQNAWEEVDIIESGGNYGWNAKEGFHSYNASTKLDGPGLAPVVEYSHDKGCSITGGYVYRGNLISELSGTYLYADFCQGTIWGLSQSKAGDYQTHILLESRLMIASFAQSNAGELYVLHYGGEIYKIEVDNASP